jgi:hypothetical protein
MGSLPSKKSVAVKASGHCRTHCPRSVSKQDQVCASFEAIAGDYGCGDEHGVDGELKRVLTLPSVDKRRNTAAENQTRNEHELWRRVQEKASENKTLCNDILLLRLPILRVSTSTLVETPGKLLRTLSGPRIGSLCMVNRQVTRLQTAPMTISRLAGTQQQALGGRDAPGSFWCEGHRNKLIGTGRVDGGRRPRSGGSEKERSRALYREPQSAAWRNDQKLYTHMLFACG